MQYCNAIGCDRKHKCMRSNGNYSYQTKGVKLLKGEWDCSPKKDMFLAYERKQLIMEF